MNCIFFTNPGLVAPVQRFFNSRLGNKKCRFDSSIPASQLFYIVKVYQISDCLVLYVGIYVIEKDESNGEGNVSSDACLASTPRI